MTRIVQFLLVWSATFVAVAAEPPTADRMLAQSAPAASSVRLWQPGDPGTRLHLRGRVIDLGGRPVAGANLRVRQADGSGAYTGQYQTSVVTGADGTFSLATVLPGQYYGAKHIHVQVTHTAYPPLDTRILFKGDPHLDETREGDLAILLEEVHQDGDTMLVGGVEFVLGGGDG